MSSQELPTDKNVETQSSVTLDASSPHQKDHTQHPSSEAPPSSDTLHHSEQPERAPENPRLAALSLKRKHVAARLEALEAERSALVAESTLPSGLPFPSDWTEEQRSKQALATANAVIKEHISLLHGYNEIKDIGQGLLGMVAEKRGVRVKDIMEEFGVGIND